MLPLINYTVSNKHHRNGHGTSRNSRRILHDEQQQRRRQWLVRQQAMVLPSSLQCHYHLYNNSILTTNHSHSSSSILVRLATKLSNIVPNMLPNVLVKLSRIVARASIPASLATIIMALLQTGYVIWNTPRLPPPERSGLEFVREGIVVFNNGNNDDDNYGKLSSKLMNGDCSISCKTNHDYGCTNTKTNTTTSSITTTNITTRKQNAKTANENNAKRREFRLVLIGDSPVEGIGNAHHHHALGGRTAQAFAKLVCQRRTMNATTTFTNSNGGKEESRIDLKCQHDDDDGRHDNNDNKYDCVRYWSYGKSGLTAQGIQKEIIPLLHRVVNDVACYDNNTHHQAMDSNNKINSNKSRINYNTPAIHAIILLCGVNNVLDPQSTTHSFHNDVQSLITNSIRNYPGLENTPLLVLGLPDFAKLPFLPSWPLGWMLGVRGRWMQGMLERVVEEMQRKERLVSSESAARRSAITTANVENEDDYNYRRHGYLCNPVKTIIVKIPEVQDILGTIGFYANTTSSGNKHHEINDGNKINDNNNARSSSNFTMKPCSSTGCKVQDNSKLKMRLCHPLLKHLGGMFIHDKTKILSLGMNDFLCNDGFHPGKYGNVYIGSLIADAYGQMVGLQ